MILGEEQQEALAKIKQFIKSNEVAFSLTGPAGTGKTVLTKFIITWLKSINRDYCLCAPTHKAALVMRNYTGNNAVTLHSMLALSPNIQILELDLRELKFVTGRFHDNIPFDGVVICDESSMINDDLFELLIEKVKDRNSKIIFVSDYAQLLPVKQKHYSKIYNLKNSYKLTKIYRQSEKNSILPVLQELRSHEIMELSNCPGEEGSLIVTDDLRKFIEYAIPEIKEAINCKNIIHTKIAAFTNKRVELYNSAIRKFLGFEEEYHVGDILTAYENGEYNRFEYYNSMDYIIVDTPIKSVKVLPFIGAVSGWELKLWDQYNEYTFTIFILSKDNPEDLFSYIAENIEYIRIKAIEAKKNKLSNSSKLWGNYYDLIHSFCTPIDLYYEGRVIRKKSFDYGYAITVHKSQGSTYDSIFVDWKNIKTCKDDLVRRQLQYVALSRTRSNAYILQ